MTKTAVQIDLAYVDDELDTMSIHGILSDGKLASLEMYCHLYEARDGVREYQFGRLNDDDGLHCRYVAEWGCGDDSSSTFDFLDRPLAVGQQVTRTDTIDNERHVYVYKITSICDLMA